MLPGAQQKIIRVAVGLKSLFALLRDDKTTAVHLQPSGFHWGDAATQQLFTQTPALCVGPVRKTRLHRDFNGESVRVFEQYLKQPANEYTCMSTLFWLHLVKAGGGSGAQDSTKLPIVLFCHLFCLFKPSPGYAGVV